MDPAPDTRSWWQIILASLRGEPHDYTRGNLTRAIWLLAIPMVLEMAMESTFAIVDETDETHGPETSTSFSHSA